MGDHTGIEWTDATWNPIVGCSIVSPGCTNCYAMKQAARLLDGNPKAPHYAGTTRTVNGNAVWTGKVAPAPEHILTQPLRWSKPRRIFVNSMGDLFHEDVPEDEIARVFNVMAMTPWHTYQILTKRADRMRRIMAGPKDHRRWSPRLWHRSVLPNVWFGISAEDQTRFNARIADLHDTPAAVRFISAEPLLGGIDMALEITPAMRIDWVIAGGESGPGARPMHPDWARSLRDQCADAGVPFYFKQWGDWHPLLDRERDDPDWRADYSMRFSDDRSNIAWLNLEGGRGFHGERFHIMERAGKARAGRLLDGIEHNAFPMVAA